MSTGMTIRGIWGWPMLHGEPLICNNLQSHPDRVGFPKKHVQLRCFLGVPLKPEGKVVGMVAVANKPGGYTQEDCNILTRLASVVSVSRQHRLALIATKRTSAALEQIVSERTKQLQDAKDQLEEVVEKRTKELREAQERFNGIFNSSKDAIKYATLEGAIVDLNDAFCQLTGYSRKEWLAGKTYQSITPEEYHEYEAKIVEEILRTGQPAEYEKEYIRKDSSRVPILLTTFIVKGADGKPIGLAAMIKDITERKQMEERLLTAEQLATLGQFSGSISHELRNPLGVIDSSVYYLKKKLEDANRKVQEHLDRIQYSVGNATTIIDSLLNLTRMKEPKLAKLELTTITSDAIATSKVPAKVNVIRNFPEQEVLVTADQEQLRMAFQNIMKNAVEATDSEGTLTVTVHTTADGQAEVSFADTGPGVAAENLDKIFQPLFSTKAKGIGFGLSIAKTIIDKHGGTIEAKSEPGKGATFIIRFPPYVTKEANK